MRRRRISAVARSRIGRRYVSPPPGLYVPLFSSLQARPDVPKAARDCRCRSADLSGELGNPVGCNSARGPRNADRANTGAPLVQYRRGDTASALFVLLVV